MLKKILSMFVLITLIFSSMSFQVFADSTTNYYRDALTQYDKGESYAEQIDMLIPQMSDEKLEEIMDRIDTITLEGDDMMVALIMYLEYMIGEEMQSRMQEAALEKIELEISTEGMQAAEVEILAMQERIGEGAKEMIDALILSWEGGLKFEERGDFEMNVDMNIPDVFEMEGQVNIRDYTSIMDGFDQQFTGEIQAMFEAMENGEAYNFELETILDLIIADGNYYALMEKLGVELSEQMDEELQIIIRKVQELAEKNIYLSFEDADTEMILTMLENFSVENIDAQIDTYLENALFEAYKKEGNSYHLRPSKVLCDLGKQAIIFFDPFAGSECSDAQYEDMLLDFFESGITIIMTPGKNNELKIMLDDRDDPTGEMTISWNDREFIAFIGMLEDADLQKNNVLSWEIRNGSKIILDAAFEGFSMDMDIALSRNNEIETVDASYLADGWYMQSSGSLEYRGNTLEVEVMVEEDGEEVLNCVLEGELRSDYADLEGKCNMPNWYSYFIEGEEIEARTNFELDMRNSKNNLDMDLKIQIDGKDFFTMDMKNEGTRKNLQNTNITAPENTKSVDEFYDEVYEEMYGADWDTWEDDWEYDDSWEYEEVEVVE